MSKKTKPTNHKNKGGKAVPNYFLGPNPTVVAYTKSAFPDRYYTSLRYVSSRTLTTTTASDRLKFCSSLYDPDVSGIGHQPYHFDTLAQVYAKYTVVSMDYKVRCYNDSDTEAAYVCVMQKAENTATTGTELALERPRSAMRIVQPRGSNCSVTISGRMDVATVHGIPPFMVQSDDRYNSNMSTSPSKLSYLFIHQDSPDGLTAVQLRYVVEINYKCVLFQRVLASQSYIDSNKLSIIRGLLSRPIEVEDTDEAYYVPDDAESLQGITASRSDVKKPERAQGRKPPTVDTYLNFR